VEVEVVVEETVIVIILVAQVAEALSMPTILV
jgi:hypothetical protein